MQGHAPEGQNTCDILPEGIQTQGQPNETQKAQWEKKFKCPHCTNAYYESSSLKHHIESMHDRLGTLDFKCNQCDKAFKTQRAMKVHEKRHAPVALRSLIRAWNVGNHFLIQLN